MPAKLSPTQIAIVADMRAGGILWSVDLPDLSEAVMHMPDRSHKSIPLLTLKSLLGKNVIRPIKEDPHHTQWVLTELAPP